MRLSLTKGTTSKIIHVFLEDATVTTGAGKTALTDSSMTAYYVREGNTLSAMTLEGIATLGTWAVTDSNYLGFKKLDDTNAPGIYEVHLPNNILATGADSVTIQLRATNTKPLSIEIELTDFDKQDAVRGGLTALPNANAAASGGLIINGSNTGTVTLAALTVSGATTLTGAVSMGSTFGVTGATTFTGNVALAAGLTITQSTGNGHGITVTGNGTGSGLRIVAGATGSGVAVVGGSTSGAGVAITTTSGTGLSIVPTAGDGVNINAAGTNARGIYVAAVGAGTTYGVYLAGGDYDLRCGNAGLYSTGCVLGACNLGSLGIGGTTTFTGAVTFSSTVTHSGLVTLSAGAIITRADTTASLRITNTGGGYAWTMNAPLRMEVQQNAAIELYNAFGSTQAWIEGDLAGNVTGALSSFAAGAITSSSFSAGAINAAAINTGAITSAKFASGAINAAALATDAVTEIDTALSTAHGNGAWGNAAGSGAFVVTVTVTNASGGAALQSAIVRLTEGANVYSVATNASGVATFALSAATYTRSISKGGFTHTPDTIVVSASANFATTMTSTGSITPPADPAICALFGTMFTPTGAVAANVPVTATLVVPGGLGAEAGGLVAGRTVSTTTNGSGAFQLDLIRTDSITTPGCSYTVECEAADFLKKRVKLTASTKDIATLIP